MDQWRETIKAARLKYRHGGETVVDLLIGSRGESSALEIVERTGIALADVQQMSADWLVLDIGEAQRWDSVVLKREGDAARWVAMADPWSDDTVRKVSRRVGRSVEPLAASRSMLQVWFDTAVAAVSPALVSGASGDESSSSQGARPSNNGPSQSSVVPFTDECVGSAYRIGASDIHFECDRAGITVKHRIDGVMVRHARMEGVQSAQEVISRIKVLAQLDITERRIPQDGRFRFPLKAHPEGGIDLRVSIMPSIFGEDAVLRLLDKAQLRSQDAPISLDLLGFEHEGAQLIRELANEPSGMLLVTGPTGSGKTTTVYAALSEINTGLEKIITIEDPVEYELPGVLQIPVNERKGLTFAKGLRSILRHDPDRILVGEIRDSETAEIAVQSALTGHLVFTTVHANSMADIMGRFRHFGLDMFGFMSSLNGVVVQRLMRRVCPQCVDARAPKEREVEWFMRVGHSLPAKLPQAAGCVHCNDTGYKGRFVVSEVHVVDDGLRDMVVEGAPVSSLKRHAVERGVMSLSMHAATRVAAFETTLEEVKRVVGWL